MNALTPYDEARQALANAKTIDDVLDIKDMAERARIYARRHQDRSLEADAIEIRLQAGRKAGELLLEIKRGGALALGGRPKAAPAVEPETGAETSADEEPVFVTLAELGLSKKESAAAQKLAEMPLAEFKLRIGAAREKVLAAGAKAVGGGSAGAPAPVVVKPLEQHKWRQFAYSAVRLARELGSDESRRLLDLAEQNGIVVREDENVVFSPAARLGLGTLAAAERDTKSPALHFSDHQDGAKNEVLAGVTGGESAAPLSSQILLETYEGEIALLGGKRGQLTQETAAPILRAGVAANVPTRQLVEDLGHGRSTVSSWITRLGLGSKERQLAGLKHQGGAA